MKVIKVNYNVLDKNDAHFSALSPLLFHLLPGESALKPFGCVLSFPSPADTDIIIIGSVYHNGTGSPISHSRLGASCRVRFK